MAFELSRIVPWGRSFEEYVDMFALSGADLSRRMLGCGDGPAGFNAVLTQRGGNVVSVDPLYRCSRAEIEQRISDTYDEILHQVTVHRDDFIWNRIRSPDELGRIRKEAMQLFLEDYNQGRAEKRYLPMQLPRLDVPDGAFQLCVSSHFLFLYSRQLDLDFHLAAVDELCRVADEVRIFPLLQLGTEPSPYVAPVSRHLRDAGYEVEEIEVPYEFQRGGNRMLRITRKR